MPAEIKNRLPVLMPIWKRVRKLMAMLIFGPDSYSTNWTYPPGCMYALSYGEGIFQSAELLSLIQYGLFYDFFYFGAKSLANEPRVQLDFLQKVLTALALEDKVQIMESLTEIHRRFFEGQSILVKSSKAASVSRYDLVTFQAKSVNKIKELLSQQFEVVLVTHVPLYFLSDLIKLYQESGLNKLRIISDKWINDTNNLYCGYEIEITNNTFNVSLWEKSRSEWQQEMQTKQLVVFDDAAKTGRTLEVVVLYLSNVLNVPAEKIKTAVTVDLRTQQN